MLRVSERCLRSQDVANNRFTNTGFETDVMKYGTDIPKLELDRKFEKYLYGPGTIFVAHSVNENVTVGALEEAVESYKKLVLNALDR